MMTVQWTLIATFLYFELAFIFFLLLPFISSKIWQSIFYSRIFKAVISKANTYFSVMIMVLFLFFLDSLREMWKYSEKHHKDFEAAMQMNMKLFRSQRNYYISGFSIFLSLVIRRLIMLLVIEADLLSETEIAMKRAHSATETFEKLMRKKDQYEELSSSAKEELSDDVEKLQKTLKSTKFDLDCTRRALLDVEEQGKQKAKEFEILFTKT
ncbi:B-cell receptor-associated protein 31-like [Uloborus diversus]|uniref:B-cell receptor-associated protein 31-like n=1 Tax=Uloborus diversus TaxID=327109 RepID=UPI0024091969|nr:B-cell receptor-associated protein 31-like [Uloborus diversus]